MSGAYGYPGWGTQPHDEAAAKEHFDQVGKEVRHDREAHKVAKSRAGRPWWRFRRKRTG